MVKRPHGRKGTFLWDRNCEWGIFLQMEFKELLEPWSYAFLTHSPSVCCLSPLFNSLFIKPLFSACCVLWTQEWIRHKVDRKESMVLVWIQKYTGRLKKAPWAANTEACQSAQTKLKRANVYIKKEPKQGIRREAKAPRLLDWKNYFLCAQHIACGILVPRPGIKPGASAVRLWSLNYWTDRELPRNS